jgi:hypothetical protein
MGGTPSGCDVEKKRSGGVARGGLDHRLMEFQASGLRSRG